MSIDNLERDLTKKNKPPKRKIPPETIAITLDNFFTRANLL